MAGKREVRNILKALEAQGWRIERKSRGWMAFPPNRDLPAVTIHETASDHRWIANVEAQARRSGYEGRFPRG